MQQLLAVAIRDVLSFNAICSKVLDPVKLDELENKAAIILCQLEMHFPTAFFDIMVHLFAVDVAG